MSQMIARYDLSRRTAAEQTDTTPGSEPGQRPPLDVKKIAAVLVGFPAIFWILSQALLHPDLMSVEGAD